MKNFDIIYAKNIEKFERKERKVNDKILEKLFKEVESGKSIGKGRTANILILEDESLDRNACVKMIYPEVKDKNGRIGNRIVFINDVLKEMDFLDILYQAGIDVPRPICSVKDVNNTDYLLMEEIDGFSIEDLKRKNLYNDLPEDFNIYQFIDELKEVIEKMHSLKIYHRDLHYGNIMIDKRGKPVIIDFGHAVKNYFADPYVYFDDIRNEQINFSKDEDAPIDIFRDIAPYLKLNNYDFKKAKMENELRKKNK